MKLKQPESFQQTLVIDGVAYQKDKDGNVDVPKEKISTSLFGFGFHYVEDVIEVKEVKQDVLTEDQAKEVIVEAIEAVEAKQQTKKKV